jgi:hypothetical protein
VVRFDRWWRRPGWDGTNGSPRSANGASSFHLFWDVPAGEWVAVEVILEVVVGPAVPDLFFWALQASFTDRGRSGGGAHLGLQWYPPHPGSTAVNWGGYRAGGGELDGSVSSLPSATGNVNTRDLAWVAGRAYLLRIAHGPGQGIGAGVPPGHTAWRGEVTDLSTGLTVVVRDLWVRGDRLESPMVWSEVFARCDGPGAGVRWSGLRVWSATGEAHAVEHVRVNYQTVADGGCTTTDVAVDERGVLQRTGVDRVTAAGARLRVPGPGSRSGR